MIDLNALVGETMKYGFPGVVIIALSWVLYQVIKQFRTEMTEKDSQLKAEREKNEALQEKRIAEGRENLTALNNATNVLNDVLDTMNRLAATQGQSK